jgi:hypothetical protein
MIDWILGIPLGLLGIAIMTAFAVMAICTVAFFIAAPAIVYRSIVGAILKNHWHLWCVRRAVDASIMGLMLLFAGPTFSILKPDQYMLEQLKADLFESRQARNVDVSKLSAYNRLEELINMQWLLDHLAPLVVLPAAIVFMAGYSIERKKAGIKIGAKSCAP